MSTSDTQKSSASSSSAVAAPPKKNGAGCANCNSMDDWGHSSWCPRCGWYPALNTCVAVDPVEEETTDEVPPQWYEIIPLWAWVLGTGVVGLICLSIFARISTTLETGERGRWAVIQLFFGFIFLVAGQAWAYLYAVMKSSDFGPADIAFRPFAIWGPSNRLLPKSFPRLAMAVWGALAALLAVTVIGGINYNVLFEDWGFEEQAQVNIVHEIVRQAREAEAKDESLEEAMNDFAGDAEAAQEEETLEPAVKMDCLIIGYTGDSPQEFTGLVLASLVKGKLQYVGTVYKGISDEDRAILADRLAKLERDRPFIDVQISAHWLQPKLMCRIGADELNKKSRLKNPVFSARLADTE